MSSEEEESLSIMIEGSERMKIVTYNVNGLRPRISQFGSITKLLDSFDADIVCFQETKLSKHELSADLAIANGYESFFSCTRTTDKGRIGYSGVATFCRIKSAFSSSEVALPIAAEEGFTGLLEHNRGGRDDMAVKANGLEEFKMEELVNVDSEGRCVITDHDQFVLFNIYGPRAECDDMERTQFKINFFEILQKRWESLLHHGRRVIVVGDLNIAPSAMDSSRAGPDFEKNECRRWFRSSLVEFGGSFLDVFRTKHPDRKDAYTCWPQNTGAEEFNYGSRIDHILVSKSCLHDAHNQCSRNLVTCHVKDCDILTQFKRWKPDAPRWKGGRSTKLEGSDHVPIFMKLIEIPEAPIHSTPSLSTRYIPKFHGFQQTLVSVLMKRGASQNIGADECLTSGDRKFECNEQILPEKCSMSDVGNKKKARQTQWSQLSLRSFFKSSNCHLTRDPAIIWGDNITLSISDCCSSEHCRDDVQKDSEIIDRERDANDALIASEKNGIALREWQRIQQLMQKSVPRCKGHKEPCVPRVVKKPGPNFGRRFYVCARAEGPSTNPEANCNYFKWAASWSKQK